MTSIKTENPDDVTAKELAVISATGEHPDGEKALADLRKRKLIVQKSVACLDLTWYVADVGAGNSSTTLLKRVPSSRQRSRSSRPT